MDDFRSGWGYYGSYDATVKPKDGGFYNFMINDYVKEYMIKQKTTIIKDVNDLLISYQKKQKKEIDEVKKTLADISNQLTALIKKTKESVEKKSKKKKA